MYTVNKDKWIMQVVTYRGYFCTLSDCGNSDELIEYHWYGVLTTEDTPSCIQIQIMDGLW